MLSAEKAREEMQMAYRMTFRRYELKFMLTLAQKQELLRVMEPYMERAEYGRTTIRNLYYDTDAFLDQIKNVEVAYE